MIYTKVNLIYFYFEFRLILFFLIDVKEHNLVLDDRFARHQLDRADCEEVAQSFTSKVGQCEKLSQLCN